MKLIKRRKNFKVSGLFVFCSQMFMKESKYTCYSRCISNSKVLLQWSRYKSQLTKTPAAKIWRLLHPLSLSYFHFLPLKTTSWGGAKLGSALLVVFSSLPNGGFPLLRRPLAPPCRVHELLLGLYCCWGLDRGHLLLVEKRHWWSKSAQICVETLDSRGVQNTTKSPKLKNFIWDFFLGQPVCLVW